MNKDIKRILILRLSAIGDTIHTLPLAYALKQKFPAVEIGWVVEDKAALFVDGNPLVDKCYVLPKKSWKKRGFSINNIREFFDIISQINRDNYDIALDTQQLLKSSLLLPFLKIPRKITLSGGREFSFLFSNEVVKAKHELFDYNYHVVNRNLELASYLGVDSSEIKFVLKDANESVKQKIDSLLNPVLDNTKKTVVISPATTWANKHWDESYWTDVLKFLNSKVNVVFTGMESDKALIDRIIPEGFDNPIILTGKTNLEELAEVFRRADMVISPDSGSAHVAWAVSKPFVLTIFTATAEKRNAPFGDNCVALYPQLECHPCMKKKCKYSGTRKNQCVSFIKPENVIDIVKNVLQLC